MKSDKQQTVLLGVTGSIAAYKACELLRLFQKEGLRVKVVMTKHAQELVGAATFKALSKEPVAVDLFDDPQNPINHISLSEEADIMVIAPCTANVINKIANGVADDLLTTTALATTAPLLIAPAMNVNMLKNPHTQDSLARLETLGATLVGPGEGYLACGTEDSGRMSEPAEICAAALKIITRTQSLAQKRVLITAGPTREFLDPVRFISSPSSGKTGFALAREAAARGAEVILVRGPTELPDPPGVECVPVVSATQMLAAASEHFADADIAIFSAAVADFRPAEQAAQKLKKGVALPGMTGESVSRSEAAKDNASGSQETKAGYDLRLIANPDILATLAAQRNSIRQSGVEQGKAEQGSTNAPRPFIVGFAAETEDLITNAKAKLKAKGADLIIANDVSRPGLGFASSHNQVAFVDEGSVLQTEVLSKEDLARLILDTIIEKMC